MKSRRGFVGLAVALALVSALAAQEAAYAQSTGFPGAEETRIWKADPLGVSPLLVGQWKNSINSASDPKYRTEMTLQNPTSNSQAALIIYYDDNENFLQCDVQYLSPHDLASFIAPVVDFTGASMVGKSGAFEIVTSAAAGIEFKGFQPDGNRAGYGPSTTRTFMTESLHDGLVGSFTIRSKVGRQDEDRTIAMHLVNFRYFSPPENGNLFDACVCEKDPADFNFLPGVDCYGPM